MSFCCLDSPLAPQHDLSVAGNRGPIGAKVLILDANTRSALAATRSLGKRGVEVVAADETRTTLAGTSKYCKASFCYPSPYKRPAAFIDALRNEIETRHVRLALPMTDITAYLTLKNRECFEDVVVPFGEFKAFELLSDKAKLYSLARELHIPIPTTYVIRGSRDLTDACAKLGFPVVLKPYRSRIWSEGRWISATVRYGHSVDQVEKIVAENECFNRHPFLVQEYIHGEGRGIFALYDRGEPVVFFAHRRIREKPPTGGVSVLSESVEVDPHMREISRRIFDHVGWHGVAMAEFKKAVDGTLHLLEVNARFWGSLQLAIDSGVDFPWLLYQVATGNRPLPVSSYKVGLKSRWLLGDLAHLWRILFNDDFIHKLTASQKLALAVRFLNFFEGDTRYDVNRWDDPAPFAVELRRRLFGRIFE